MPTLLKFKGLDLPEFPADKVAINKRDFADAAMCGNETFVRHTQCRALGFTSLKQALTATDKELRVLGELCGAKVINYKWGLFRRDRAMIRQVDSFGISIFPVTSPLLPKDYLLAAEVQSIVNAGEVIDDLVLSTLKRGLTQYYAERDNLSSNQPMLTDMSPCQFVIDPAHQNSDANCYLIDIEPMIIK